MNHPENKDHAPTLVSYLAGYAISILLTLVAFGLAMWHVNSDHEFFSHDFLAKTVVALAIVQLYVQAVFFLHLSRHKESRYNLISFIFTIFIVLFIVIGSIWIMNNLNTNMNMDQINAYLRKEN